MWIRSQDKKRLINSTNFGTNFNKVIAFNEEGMVVLGIYETEERSIGVLEEMQIHIEALEQVKCGNVNFTLESNSVFTMPEK